MVNGPESPQGKEGQRQILGAGFQPRYEISWQPGQ
jgi:hypothetical protein